MSKPQLKYVRKRCPCCNGSGGQVIHSGLKIICTGCRGGGQIAVPDLSQLPLSSGT